MNMCDEMTSKLEWLRHYCMHSCSHTGIPKILCHILFWFHVYKNDNRFSPNPLLYRKVLCIQGAGSVAKSHSKFEILPKACFHTRHAMDLGIKSIYIWMHSRCHSWSDLTKPVPGTLPNPGFSVLKLSLNLFCFVPADADRGAERKKEDPIWILCFFSLV